MKKLLFISILFGMASTVAVAQDDMYFTPKKKDKKEVREYLPPKRHTGCDRNIDEYNRRGNFRSRYNVIDSDSTANDIIDFAETMPSDTLYYNGSGGYDEEDDYTCSRRMSRFDDYYWRDPFYWDTWYGSPYWYGSAYWYGSPYWYARYGWGWYDPWYYGGWYSPYYWGWGGWHHHIHHPVVAYHPRGWRTGTNNRVVTGTSNRRFAQRNDTGRRTTRWNNNSYRNTNRTNSFGQNSVSRPSYSTGSFGGNRGSFSGGNRGGSFGGGGGGARSGGRR